MWGAQRLRIRNDRRGLIRVSALTSAAIHGRGHVVVSLAGDDRAVGVCGGAVERSADHRVRAPRHGAAIEVVADGARRGVPSEVHRVLRGRRTGARHSLHRGRVRRVTRKCQGRRTGSACLRRESDRERSGLTGGNCCRQRDSGEHKLTAVQACRGNRDRGAAGDQAAVQRRIRSHHHVAEAKTGRRHRQLARRRPGPRERDIER